MDWLQGQTLSPHTQKWAPSSKSECNLLQRGVRGCWSKHQLNLLNEVKYLPFLIQDFTSHTVVILNLVYLKYLLRYFRMTIGLLFYWSCKNQTFSLSLDCTTLIAPFWSIWLTSWSKTAAPSSDVGRFLTLYVEVLGKLTHKLTQKQHKLTTRVNTETTKLKSFWP